MNKKIKQLWNNSIEEFSKQHQYATIMLPEPLREKFAELIVRECTEQVKGQYVPVLEDKEMMKDTHWDGYVQCGVDSVVAIREHFFGVEE
jgi:hypothetical protein